MNNIFFYPFLVEGYLVCFQFMVTMNKAAMNTVEYVSLWYDGEYFGYIPRISGSLGRMISNFLGNHQIEL